MKRRNKNIVALLMVFAGAMSVGGLAGCNPDKPEEPPVIEQTQATVTFVTNGGSAVPDQGVMTGEKLIEPGAPVKYAYDFVGWYKDEKCTQKWTFETDTVTGNMTLYALWEIKDATADTYFDFALQEDGSYAISAKAGQTLPQDVVLPTVHEEVAVTAIASRAFDGQAAVKSVYIPDTYQTVGSMAFRNCSNLAYVQEGENVEMIGSNAFYGTAWETAQSGDVYIGKCYYKYIGDMAENTELTVKEGTLGIADSALAGQKNLVKINLPEGLKAIGSGAFGGGQAANGTGLTEVVLPESVVSIGDNSFRNSSSLATVSLGSNVESIGSRAFANTAVSSFTYNSDATLGDYIFEGVTVEGTLTVGDAITELPMGLIEGWEGLTALHLGAGITKLPASAFATLPGLKEIVADNVTTIGQYAFSGTAIESFTISEKVTSIGAQAFKGCASLKTVYYNAPDVTDITSATALFSECAALEKVVLGDNIEKIPAYLFYKDAQTYAVQFGANVKEIGSYAFYNSSVHTGTVGEFAIPDSVQTVGTYAFDGATYTKFTVGEGLKEVNQYSFVRMQSLTTLVWNAIDAKNLTLDGATNGSNMFTYSSSTRSVNSILSSLTFGEKVESIPAYFLAQPSYNVGTKDFRGKELLTVTIPVSVKHIGTQAFSYNVNLATVNGLENVANVARDAFLGSQYQDEHLLVGEDGLLYLHNNKTLFTYLGTIPADFTLTIPDGIEIIADNAFASNSYMTIANTNIVSIVLPEGLKEIGAGAFSGCSKIAQDIVFPASLEKIGDYAFSGASGITGYDFSKCTNLKYIGDGAFYSAFSKTNGTPIDTLTLAQTEYLGKKAFYGVYINNVKVTSPYLTEIPTYTFYGCNVVTVELAANITKLGDSWCSLKTCTSLVAPGVVEVGANGLANLNDPNFDLSKIKSFGNRALVGIQRETVVLGADSIGTALFGYASINSGSGAVTVVGSTPMLKSVTFTGKITALGGAASSSMTAGMFEGCTALEEVIVPDTVTAIGDFAFYGCTALTSFDFSHIKTIGQKAFNGGSGLLSVNFSDELESLGTYCFDGAPIEGEVVLGGKLTTVPAGAFQNCGKITKVTIKGNVLSVENASFRYCSSLAEIVIEEGVKTVGGFASVSSRCVATLPSTTVAITQLTPSVVKFTGFCEPDLPTTTLFNPSAVVCNDAETQAKFKASEKWAAFADKVITTGNIVQDVWYLNGEGSILSYLGAKTNIVVPKEVKNINLSKIVGTAVATYQGVTSLTLEDGNTTYVTDENGVIYDKDKTQLVYYPVSLTATAYSAPSTVTAVGDYAFFGNAVLTSVELPNVTSVGMRAFSDCTALATVTGSKLEGLGSYAFYNCSLLTSVNLGSVTTIGNYAFTNCALLASVDLRNVETLGTYVFQKCVALTEVALTKLTTVGNYAFNGCTELTTVTGAFTEVGSNAFNGCTKLSSFPFAQLVTIGTSAFVSCTSLTSVSLDNIETIGNTAFQKCTALHTVVIGEKITSIGTNSFASGDVTMSVTIKATVAPTIKANSFGTKTAFKGTIYVPAASVDAYKAAAIWSANYVDMIQAIPETGGDTGNDTGSGTGTDTGTDTGSGDASTGGTATD